MHLQHALFATVQSIRVSIRHGRAAFRYHKDRIITPQLATTATERDLLDGGDEFIEISSCFAVEADRG